MRKSSLLFAFTVLVIVQFPRLALASWQLKCLAVNSPWQYHYASAASSSLVMINITLITHPPVSESGMRLQEGQCLWSASGTKPPTGSSSHLCASVDELILRVDSNGRVGWEFPHSPLLARLLTQRTPLTITVESQGSTIRGRPGQIPSDCLMILNSA